MKYSEILKRAKKHLSHDFVDFRIKTDKDLFICCAIDYVMDSFNEEDFNKGIELKKTIQKRLGNHYTVESWLMANNLLLPDLDSPSGFNVSKRQIQAYRHRWLDSLVSEYQSKGE